MLDLKNIDQKLQKTYVGKAATIAKKEFEIFDTMLFREKSEKLEPQIRKNWSRPSLVFIALTNTPSNNALLCSTIK